jgi:chromate reductase, NAD(P)H dehydrogenase (quinone)
LARRAIVAGPPALDGFLQVAYRTRQGKQVKRIGAMAGKTFRLLGLSGSIRRQSYCKAILETIREKAAADTVVNNFDLEPIPPYNQDIDNEKGYPASIRALRKEVIEADGIIAVTPEYNHGMSGILKNAIDWVSRPGYESILKGKVVLTISVSNRGGIRAQNQMHATFLSCVCRITPGREIVVMDPPQKITDGRVTDEQMLRVVMRGVDTMLDEICLFQGLPKRNDPAAEKRKSGPRPKGD